jgi:hypothetical protein
MSKEINYITIDNTFRFGKCDDKNFVLEQFKTVHAKKNRYLEEARDSDKWVEVGFYSDVKAVVNSIVNRAGALEAETVDNLKAIVKRMEYIAEEVCKTIANTGLTLESFDKPVDGRGRKTAVEEAQSTSVKKTASLTRAQTIAKQAAELKQSKKKKVAAVSEVRKRGRPAKVK